MKGNALTFEKYVSERKMLGDNLPLEMPYTFGIHVTNLCNFKCFYCTASESPEIRKSHNIVLKSIDFELYKKAIDILAKEGHLKVLFLGGWGEPLIHKDIAKMVKYAKDKNVADIVRIYTNASLLTHEMSDSLIEAGLDNLRISVQGLKAEDYKTVALANIDYDKFMGNIKYLYEHKTNMVVTVKIIDIMVDEAGKREEFVRQFENICDEYMIDSLTPKVTDIDYSNMGSELNKSFLEGKAPETDICAVPFYRSFIDVDGQVFPCPAIPTVRKFGDITENGFKAIWQGKVYNEFLVEMLKGNRKNIAVCKDCKEYRCHILPTDMLDNYAEDLLPKYREITK